MLKITLELECSGNMIAPMAIAEALAHKIYEENSYYDNYTEGLCHSIAKIEEIGTHLLVHAKAQREHVDINNTFAAGGTKLES